MVDIADTITIEEFIEILDRRPDLLDALRQRVLTRELLELPEKFAAFSAEMRAFVAETRAFSAETRAFVAEMHAFVAETRGNFVRVDARLDRVEGRLGNLEGWRYEAKLARMLPVLCMTNLNMTDPVILMAEGRDHAPEFNSMAQTLLNAGKLDAGDFTDILDCDAITRDRQNRYALFEASITVGESDVERAWRRSKLLSEALDAPVTPVVVGAEISDGLSARAADQGVPFIRLSIR